jgi:hypothetical protein
MLASSRRRRPKNPKKKDEHRNGKSRNEKIPPKNGKEKENRERKDSRA